MAGNRLSVQAIIATICSVILANTPANAGGSLLDVFGAFGAVFSAAKATGPLVQGFALCNQAHVCQRPSHRSAHRPQGIAPAASSSNP